MFPVYKLGITLNELPDCISFYIQFHNCHIRCKGCHSSFLWEDTGNYLSYDSLMFYAKDNKSKGCDSIVIFGDINNGIKVDEFCNLCSGLSSLMPLCVFSGADTVTDSLGDVKILNYLSYLKLGHFDVSLGGLASPHTNQKLYTIQDGQIKDDITYRFWR